jgi:spore coat protein U-like protein
MIRSSHFNLCMKRLMPLVMGIFMAGTAWGQGQCSNTASVSPNFGSLTSFQAQTTALTTSANSVAQCSGGLLNAMVVIGDPPYLRATISGSANNYSLMNTNGSGDSIAYKAYADPTFQYELTPGVAFNYYQQTVLNILGLLGGTSANLPMYFQTTAGANVSAGTYTDTFVINWSWHICNVGAGLCLGYTDGSGTTNVTLTMTITNACNITSAPNVNFGQAPTVSSFQPVNQDVSVLCTKGLNPYTVGMSVGQNVAADGKRRLANNGTFLQYDIFNPSTGNVWGNTGGSRVNNPGGTPANGLTPQLFPYRVQIYSNQTTPPPAVYVDSVVVDVSF